MNGYNFTDGTRAVLMLAREESARLYHEYVGTEHILLGLLRRNEGAAVEVLRRLGADLDHIRETIEQTVQPGRSSRHAADLPYTSRAKVVLELSMTTARELDHAYVGTEHLLLGMLREQKGVAAQALMEAGVTETSAREAVLALLGTTPRPGASGALELQPSDRGLLALVVVEMRYGGGWRHRREFISAADAIAFLTEQR